jgi:malate dehydrogenase (oxaloacetate-decarboxylating)(NADP+)
MSQDSSLSANTRDNLRQAALDYHELPTPGKLSIAATKQITNQRDLSLAYSPGVAAPCEAIAADPLNSYKYTARGNLVAVITNGTAVLGLGAIGPLAAKPVMEGKAVLFKKFAGVDVFDIEIDERDPDRLVDIIASLEPTFGGINLEDIKAPECFMIERSLRERLKIPVFHDDQHGTAIIVSAALLNGLKVVGKDLKQIKVVVSGAGAAALACVSLLVELGLPPEHVWLSDIVGVVYQGRAELMDPEKERFAQATPHRTLGDIIGGADVFLGLSAGGVLKQDMVKRMNARPLIFALANPTPEILPEEVTAARTDAIIATGRSDYPNQVNNVLCFPYIFRGALDVGATTITTSMKIAAVHAIAELARREQSDVVAMAYGAEEVSFGPQYIIPKPFDPRLLVSIAPQVARAAMESGVASRPLTDLVAYQQRLQQFVYQSGTFMQPIFAAARRVPPERARIAFAEGEQERVLRAAQILVDEKLARPILIGRPAVIEKRLQRYGLRIKRDVDFTIVNTENDERYRDYSEQYRKLMGRRGVTEQYAKLEMRRRTTLIAAMLLKNGEADGMICGTISFASRHLQYIERVIGRRPGASVFAAMNALLLPNRQIFIVDTHVNYDPTAEQLADITILAAEGVRRFGIEPKVALLSHSNFGNGDSVSSLKMRRVLELVRARAPELEIDGEMQGDSALDEVARRTALPETTLTGSANLLVLPNLDSANIAYNLLKTASGNNVAIGPMLLGCAASVNVLTPAATVRRIVNVAAITVVDANTKRAAG